MTYRCKQISFLFEKYLEVSFRSSDLVDENFKKQ